MRALVQRVTSGQVDVRDADGKIRTTGKIGKGMVVLFGVSIDDKLETAAKLADKCAALRCFEDENGKINLDIIYLEGLRPLQTSRGFLIPRLFLSFRER